MSALPQSVARKFMAAIWWKHNRHVVCSTLQLLDGHASRERGIEDFADGVTEITVDVPMTWPISIY